MAISEFDRILRAEVNTRTILIYGKTDEMMIAKDLCLYPFRRYLSEVLRRTGFDAAIFYDATKTLGKYVLDDDSAYYAFPENRRAYHRLYGSAPKGKQPAPEPAAQQPAYRAGETEEPPVREANGLVYSQRFMHENVFFNEFSVQMRDRTHRTAVIVTNLFDTLRNSDDNFSRRLSVYINDVLESEHDNPNNLLIFLEPDVHDSCSADALTETLVDSSLRDRFMLRSGDRWILDSKRSFRIGDPEADEIGFLLRKFSLERSGGRQLRLEGDIEALSETLLFYLRDGCERERNAGRHVRPVTLRELEQRIREVLSDPAHSDRIVRIRQDNIGMLCPYQTKFERNPAEKLRTTRGWETVCEPMFSAISAFHAMHSAPQQAAAAADTWTVNRLAGGIGKTYPAAPELPHIMLLGEPGVGKTEIARLIAQIFRDNGMLSIGHCVEAKASDLISDHVGGTAPLVTEQILNAQGGVLFIDEAYDLYEKSTVKGGGSFRREAINVLVQALTNPNYHFLLVLAGYANSAPDAEDGVEALFLMNKGLSSRIKICAKIPSFKADHLAQIAADTAAEYGCTFDAAVTRTGLVKLWEKKLRTRNRRDWANAREVKNYMNKVIGACRCRGAFTILPEDFPADDRAVLSGTEQSCEKILEEISAQYPGLGGIASGIAEQAIARERSARARAKLLHKPYVEGRIAKHLIFCGRPGTGKSTIGKAFAHLMGACHLMSGADAVYVEDAGHISAKELAEKIRSAREQNTVLLLDEAYALSRENAEALLSPMTEYSDLLVIFCVYPDELKCFQEKNAGLASRCDVYFIDDYSPEALGEIFVRFCEKEGYETAPGLNDELAYLFRHRYALRDVDKNYANARDVHNLFEKMCTSCDMRAGENGPFLLTAEDIPQESREIITLNKRNSRIGDILAELDEYVGFEEVRRLIVSLKNAQDFDKFCGIGCPGGRMPHYTFLGAPGTGKTTAARVLARALYALNEIKTPCYHEISARDLIAGYVGQTAEKAHKMLEECREGLVLIDEAYMLASEGSTGGVSDFRDEAIAELLLFLEKEQGHTVVVFAGYADRMEDFIRSNPGLESRIGGTLYFRDYTEEECLEIVRRNLAKTVYHLEMTPEAEEACLAEIRRLEEREDFANARTMRNLSGKIVTRLQNRIVKLLAENPALTREEVRVRSVLPEDIPALSSP